MKKKQVSEPAPPTPPPVVAPPPAPQPPKVNIQELQDKLSELKKKREKKGVQQQKEAFKNLNLRVQARMIEMKKEVEVQNAIGQIEGAGYVMTSSEEDELERKINNYWKQTVGHNWYNSSHGGIGIDMRGDTMTVVQDPCPTISLEEMEELHAEASADRILVRGEDHDG